MIYKFTIENILQKNFYVDANTAEEASEFIADLIENYDERLNLNLTDSVEVNSYEKGATIFPVDPDIVLNANDIELNIYADGACRNNQSKENIGAWAYMAYKNSTQATYSESAVVENTTNNRMELMAVIKALEKYKGRKINLYSDSKYVVETINNGWKKRKNEDLWEELDKLIDKNVKFIYVKGHSDSVGNVLADLLCNQALDNFKGE